MGSLSIQTLNTDSLSTPSRKPLGNRTLFYVVRFYTFQDLDNILPDTGLRVDKSFSTSVGVLPNVSQGYGPFNSPKTPNCGYTDFYILVLDNTTGNTHTLIAEAYGQTAGTCPI